MVWYTTVISHLVTIVTVYNNTKLFYEDGDNIVKVCHNAVTLSLNTTLPIKTTSNILALMDFITDLQRLLGDLKEISETSCVKLVS